jgi:hypothetical protein
VSHFGKVMSWFGDVWFIKKKTLLPGLLKNIIRSWSHGCGWHDSNDYNEAKQEFVATIQWLESLNHNTAESMKNDWKIFWPFTGWECLRNLESRFILQIWLNPDFRIPFQNESRQTLAHGYGHDQRWGGITLLEREKRFQSINGFLILMNLLAASFWLRMN